jgi:DNA-binding winged helix-turn-helix (wHTH) protein/TolB-like protein/Flp pilus assembly protein TadD
MSLEESHFYEFGPFRIDSLERRLLRGEESIPLTPKVYETLLVLLENAGHGLDKDELLRRIWPDTFVEEGSLTRAIYVLRKTLGDVDGSYIETLPKRGYRFVAPVRQLLPPVTTPPATCVVDEHTRTRVVIEEETETPDWSLTARRAAAAAILIALAAGGIYLAQRRGAEPAVTSLAVLPLKNLAGGGDARHLELGIADNIIGRVSEISGLTVRPTGAVRRYLDSGADPLQAARELKVDVVLDGTLQLDGGRIRLNLNLLRTSSGSSLWTQSFEAPLDDIFNMEDTVAAQVAAQLRSRLAAGGQVHPWRHSTKNPEAYEHYLKGLYSDEVQRVTGGTRGAIEAAIVRFRKATELDPAYAQAWVQLAMSYTELLRFFAPDHNLAEQAQEAARRAAALDPDLPELHVFRYLTYWSWEGHYQVEEAIRELRRAAGYNSSDVHSRLGAIYFHAGLDRLAVAELKRAIEIDPANVLHLDRLAQAYVWGGRFDDARAAYERAFALESEAQGSIAISAVPFLYARQFEEARRRLETGRARDAGNVVAPAYLALLAALQGRFPEAEAAIPPDAGDLEKLLEAHHAFYAFASIYALEGKSAEAVRWLRKTAESGMPDYPMFARDPNLARIRRSAEFVRFLSEWKPRWDAMETEFR